MEDVLVVLLWPRVIISHAALRIVNLIAAPIASAVFYRWIAAFRGKRGSAAVPRDSFWQAFWLTLGWTTVRFAFARRP